MQHLAQFFRKLILVQLAAPASIHFVEPRFSEAGELRLGQFLVIILVALRTHEFCKHSATEHPATTATSPTLPATSSKSAARPWAIVPVWPVSAGSPCPAAASSLPAFRRHGSLIIQLGNGDD